MKLILRKRSHLAQKKIRVCSDLFVKIKGHFNYSTDI